MILTTVQMKEVEQITFARGIKPVELMEQAGKGIAEVVQQFFPTAGQCVLYCGKGNNAGDILVAGRFLAKVGWNVLVRTIFPEEKMSELTQQQMKCLKKEKSFCLENDVVKNKKQPLICLDGLLGIGVQGEVHGEIRMLIEELNKRRLKEGAFVVAADLPSGLDGTTGVPSKSCVQADLTVTIGYAKTGLIADAATNYVGRLALVRLPDLAIGEKNGTSLITSESLKALLSSRSFDVHKGLFGHVGIIAGSRGYLGAARLASTAALYAGAGLVTLFALPEIYGFLAASLPPEVMVKPINCYRDVLSEKLQAIAIGPGLGAQHHEEILAVIEKASVPCVLDADALNAIVHKISCLSKCEGPRLLTPHPGEMERLFCRQGRTRTAWATDFVKKYPVTLLLKGARTIVAEKEKAIAYNTSGNPGMASGGMGDVLTGVTAAFLASGHQAREAATLGAWLCGHAAELAVFCGSASPESLVASDVIGNLGQAMEGLRRSIF